MDYSRLKSGLRDFFFGIFYTLVAILLTLLSFAIVIKAEISIIQEISKFLATISFTVGGLIFVKSTSEVEGIKDDANVRISFLLISSGVMFIIAYLSSLISEIYPVSFISARAGLFLAMSLFLTSLLQFFIQYGGVVKELNEKYGKPSIFGRKT